MGRPTNNAARILRGSMPEPNSGCWIWLYRCFPSKEGVLRGAMNVGKQTFAAYRVSYETFVGPIPEGAMILHSCDNSLCVNPDHLNIGTHAKNMAEMVARGRHRTRSESPARLTDRQINDIKRSAALSVPISVMARQLGVSRTAVRYHANRP